MNFKIIPTLKSLIPPLSDEEFHQLEQNCIAEGIRDPLVIASFPDDKTKEATKALADGHNRLNIAEKNNLDYQTIERNFESFDAVKVWMINNQLGKRNLTDGWKWELAQAKREILIRRGRRKKVEEGKKTGRGNKKVLSDSDKTFLLPQPHNTRKQLAKDLGWSTGKIAQATKLWALAENIDGGEVIKQKVRNGEITINAGYEKIKKKEKENALKTAVWAAAKENDVAAAIKEKVLNGKKTVRSAYDEIKEIEKKGNGVIEKLRANENKEILNTPLACAYDEHIYHRSAICSPTRFGDKVFSLEDKKWFVLAGGNRFFHRDTLREFTLREYATVQTFPKDYKFVGNQSSIKKQIGNAVAPEMGQYITKNLKGKTIGDIFAGCGGFSCGAHNNGMKSLWAIEWVEDAAMSYKLNYPDTEVHLADITSIDPAQLSDVDVIIGGPPCQGFSSANPINKNVKKNFPFIEDPRNKMYKEFVRFVEAKKPAEFIMENVKEIEAVADDIIADFEAIGYSVATELVKGKDIGMRQNRQRFFFHGKKQ